MRFLLRVVAVLHPCAREVSATKDLPQLPDACCEHASLRLFNEIMVSVYIYLLLCLTDFMGENDYRDFIAWALLFIVVFTVLLNLLKFLLVCDWCYIIKKIKKKF